jgi:hypothetical protein
MTKLFNDSKKPEVLALANLRNFYRKRKQDSRLQVAESIISDLRLKCDPLPLCEWLDAEKATQDATVEEKPAAAKKSNKLPVNTLTGSTTAKAELMPVIETDRAVIVTSAQNNTAASPVFKQLQALAEHLNAKLVVLPVYYNKARYDKSEECESERFDPAFAPYLIEDDHWLYSRGGVKLAAEAAVLPTAKLPINAAEMLNSGELCTIIGSPKQQYKQLAGLNKNRICSAQTTGASTVYNYVRGRAGSEAEKDHVFGGMLYTIDDSGAINVTNLRQAIDGTMQVFLQETREHIQVSADCKVQAAPERPAIKLGDLHCEVYDEVQWQKALDLVSDVAPIFVAIDDILHFNTKSHHNRNNAGHLYATKNDTVAGDLQQVIKQVNELAAITESVYITESNHNDALTNWITDLSVTAKIDHDVNNSKLYHLIKWLVMDSIDDGVTDKNALQIALEHADLTQLDTMCSNIIFGRMDVQKIGYVYDFSQHGHKGQNGSAGSPQQFRKWNLPLVTGHTHSPCIIGRVFTTGVTGRLDQGYNRGGASGWQHGHVLEHSNGECQLIITNPQVNL